MTLLTGAPEVKRGSGKYESMVPDPGLFTNIIEDDTRFSFESVLVTVSFSKFFAFIIFFLYVSNFKDNL